MLILSHRGSWHTPNEKNGPIAFQRSFTNGFGTETDLRDRNGQVVISHDMAAFNDVMSFDEVLNLYVKCNNKLLLALNIKSDGLQDLILEALVRFEVTNYFLFDMAIPDALVSLRRGLRCFTRSSEYESTPAFYNLASGVWIDGFDSDWFEEGDIVAHLKAGKQVAIVSPELHGRDREPIWERYRRSDALMRSSDVMLCTDHPERAREFFDT